MTFKRILGVLIFIGGIALICVSNYIKNQVAEGNMEVNKAQKQVDQGSGLFSLNPVTKELGKGVTDSAQKKIDAGKQEISEYSELSGQLQLGGIALLILGAGIFFIGKGNSKK